MTTIYYLFTFAFILEEITWLFNPIAKTIKSKAKLKNIKSIGTKKWKGVSEEEKESFKQGLFSIMLLVWVFIGLLTFQWVVFLGFIILNFFIVAPLMKLTNNIKVSAVINWFNSLIGFAFGIFVIINHYHLKIDMFQLLTNYVK